MLFKMYRELLSYVLNTGLVFAIKHLKYQGPISFVTYCYALLEFVLTVKFVDIVNKEDGIRNEA